MPDTPSSDDPDDRGAPEATGPSSPDPHARGPHTNGQGHNGHTPDAAPTPAPGIPPPPPPNGGAGSAPAPWGQSDVPPPYPGTYLPPGHGMSGYGPPRSPYANFGTRLGAWLIDWVITSLIGAIVLVPLHAVHQTATANGSQSSLLSRYTVTNQGALLAVLIVFIYTTALIGSARGQSVGMMALGVKAVDAASGAPIGHARALARGVFEYLLFVLLFAPWILDMLFPLWDSRRQTLHDKVTNTVVIRT